MNCDQCNDMGLVVVKAANYDDPIYRHPHMLMGVPDLNGGVNLVLDCECHYDHPVGDEAYRIVTHWIESGKL